eukprot:4224055-Pyramimonas_sp.AAC.1
MVPEDSDRTHRDQPAGGAEILTSRSREVGRPRASACDCIEASRLATRRASGSSCASGGGSEEELAVRPWPSSGNSVSASSTYSNTAQEAQRPTVWMLESGHRDRAVPVDREALPTLDDGGLGHRAAGDVWEKRLFQLARVLGASASDATSRLKVLHQNVHGARNLVEGAQQTSAFQCDSRASPPGVGLRHGKAHSHAPGRGKVD